MFLWILAKLEVEPVAPISLQVNFGCQFQEKVVDSVGLGILMSHYKEHFQQTRLQFLHSFRIILLQLIEKECVEVLPDVTKLNQIRSVYCELDRINNLRRMKEFELGSIEEIENSPCLCEDFCFCRFCTRHRTTSKLA